jgi:hypothetical protein
MIPQRIAEYLESHAVQYESRLHRRAITAQELEKVWIAVLPATEVVDEKGLAAVLDAPTVRLLRESEFQGLPAAPAEARARGSSRIARRERSRPLAACSVSPSSSTPLWPSRTASSSAPARTKRRSRCAMRISIGWRAGRGWAPSAGLTRVRPRSGPTGQSRPRVEVAQMDETRHAVERRLRSPVLSQRRHGFA